MTFPTIPGLDFQVLEDGCYGEVGGNEGVVKDAIMVDGGVAGAWKEEVVEEFLACGDGVDFVFDLDGGVWVIWVH